MSEWKEYKISDLGKIITGKTPRTAIPNNYGGDIPFLSPSDDMDSKYMPSTARSLTEKGLSEVKNCLIPKNSICVSCIGSDMGKSVITDRPIVTNQQINSIIPSESFDPHFVYYLMQGKRREIRFIGRNGTAVPILNKSAFSNLTIKAPEIDEQRRIASILSSLDDKIAINRRICENLEAQAQALFKHWFIDFAPFLDKPSGKAERKNGKFVESELGMIPEGWRVGTLKDILKSIETGKRPKGGAQTDGIPSIGAEKIEKISCYDFSSEKYISKDFFENMTKGKIKSGDVLLYKDGAYTGKSTLFMNDFPYPKCAVNEHVFLLRTENSKWQSWLYLLLSYEPIRKYIHTLASSKAAQPGLNQTELQSVTILIPPLEVLNKFEFIINSLFTSIIQNLKENLRLSTLRDTLLPKLMSEELNLNITTNH